MAAILNHAVVRLNSLSSDNEIVCPFVVDNNGNSIIDNDGNYIFPSLECTTNEQTIPTTLEDLLLVKEANNLVQGTIYYDTLSGIGYLAISPSAYLILNESKGSGMMPYRVVEGEIFRIPNNRQGVMAMSVRVDGFILNEGFIIEV